MFLNVSKDFWEYSHICTKTFCNKSDIQNLSKKYSLSRGSQLASASVSRERRVAGIFFKVVLQVSCLGQNKNLIHNLCFVLFQNSIMLPLLIKSNFEINICFKQFYKSINRLQIKPSKRGVIQVHSVGFARKEERNAAFAPQAGSKQPTSKLNPSSSNLKSSVFVGFFPCVYNLGLFCVES